ncbi:MLP-like protein 43 [Amaranthus tricolor]|uniref:MLP-like protein 43 n=1 Tax=Amaranthus tricolor TaxID=29722 RepID=UPI00258BB312|nr:MLP-like protein 43 [Amaranthus tricolor]
MSLKRKLEGEIEIREAAGHVFHDMYKHTPHHLSHASPDFVQSCDLHEGQLGKPGSVVLWKYKLGGKPHTMKCVFEEIDEEKKLVKQRGIEGGVMEDYKSIVGTCHVIPKDKEVSIVKWTLEYEKKHAGIPEPTALLDACLLAAKHVDDHHHGIKQSN